MPLFQAIPMYSYTKTSKEVWNLKFDDHFHIEL